MTRDGTGWVQDELGHTLQGSGGGGERCAAPCLRGVCYSCCCFCCQPVVSIVIWCTCWLAADDVSFCLVG